MVERTRKLRKQLRRAAPPWVVDAYIQLLIAREFAQDFREYRRSSGSVLTKRHWGSLDIDEYVRGRLTVLSHGLEKGMTFPAPRRPFGVRRMHEMAQLISQAAAKGLAPDREDSDLAALAVERFNESGEIDDRVSPRPVTEAPKLALDDVRRFVESRHSVRNFDASRPVSRQLLMEAASLASRTPSVCNRRSYRLHIYQDPAQISSLLALQNGNRGFADTVPCLAVVTERRAAFVGPGERNQRWVDGGLFAMSYVWALHALGLSSCFLNWSQTHEKTRALRDAGGISDHEDVIVLVAVGHASDGYRVARSPLRSVNEVLVEHPGAED